MMEKKNVATIRCCLCGIFIEPNEVAMCIECIRKEASINHLFIDDAKHESDLSKGKKAVHSTSNNVNLIELTQCSKCDRWLQGKSSTGSGPSSWLHLEPESTGLLHLCLKQFVPSMQSKLEDFRLIDSFFIWTEPHSRRLKVCVNYQRSALNKKVTLQDKCVKEFSIISKQCSDCIREASDHTWGALIQIRVRSGGVKLKGNGRSVIGQLEQLLLTGSARTSQGNKTKGATGGSCFPVPVQDVQTTKDGLGMDLFFKDRTLAERAAEVIANQLPVVRGKLTTKVVSRDQTSNT